jgi:hypothetical protein
VTLRKLYGTAVSLGVAVAILLPIHRGFRSERGDSFPLSWYPMFAHHRPELEDVVYVIGREPDRTRHVIHLRYYSTGGMNTARLQMLRLTRTAKLRAATCQRIAERIAKAKRGPMSRVSEVALVRGTYRLTDYFVKLDKNPLRERVLRSCTVLRESRGNNYEGGRR